VTRFSRRESEVFELIARGLSTRKIARELGLSEHTVAGYVRRCMDKAKVHSRAQLIAVVIRTGERNNGPYMSRQELRRIGSAKTANV
jgi:DNA-binding NarL/FixJ family response regulator